MSTELTGMADWNGRVSESEQVPRKHCIRGSCSRVGVERQMPPELRIQEIPNQPGDGN